ncbi:MAG: DUF2490 domain-containing protein [Stagnimonas sp.]|nr:DUF2490 domain-containing protein [Stagnimonas sp.]
MKTAAAMAFLVGLAITPYAAQATDEAAEYWFNPSASLDLDQDTGVELETAQRFRSEADGRPDTYFARLWLNQEVARNVTLSGAFERRINDGGSNETRLIQQLSTKHGIFRTRLRLEQRFVENTDQMGLRVRPRLGLVIPVDDNKRLQFKTDAELFLTVRSTRNGGDTGLTGLRSQIGFAYEVNDRLSLSAAYLRQQDINDRGPDTVGHAPVIGIEWSL